MRSQAIEKVLVAMTKAIQQDRPKEELKVLAVLASAVLDRSKDNSSILRELIEE